jgi:hypothetical protein
MNIDWSLVWAALALIPAYGIGRAIRYQRWSPTTDSPWTINYERTGIDWHFWATRQDGYSELTQGFALTYRAAVRRSRRAVFHKDHPIRMTYEAGK